MRSLLQPSVIKVSALAAAVTGLLCLPRLLLWTARPLPLWYLVAALVLTAFVMWSFVIGWHEKYSRRKPFQFSRSPVCWALATTLGLAGAWYLNRFVDPLLRLRSPEDFPADATAWLAMTLFSLSFTGLFLVLSPLDFFLRLTRRRAVAVTLLAAFNLFFLYLKLTAPDAPEPPFALMTVIGLRMISVLLSACFYLEGGVWVFWWWSLLLQSRHLAALLISGGSQA